MARTFELGVRGALSRPAHAFVYDVTAFRTTNADDILFISSGTVANQGYFANVGDTRRQGLEASLSGASARGGGGGALDWAFTTPSPTRAS